MTIRIAIGYDPRESEAWHVCAQSILEWSSRPVNIIPVCQDHIKGYREVRPGTNYFSGALRFLVPWMMDFSGGPVIWMDSDMIFRADPAELWDMYDPHYACQVVKHDYKTKHGRKYIGSPIEADNLDYPRKNWSSLILWNCGHYHVKRLTVDYVLEADSRDLHRFEWTEERFVGELPKEWNHLVGEYPENPEAKLVHWTLGVPGLSGYHYRHDEHAAEYFGLLGRVNTCG